MNENRRSLAIPLGILVVSFLIILVSLNGIIQMAKPVRIFQNSEQAQNLGLATAIINNPNMVNYQSLKSTSSANFFENIGINKKFNEIRMKHLTLKIAQTKSGLSTLKKLG